MAFCFCRRFACLFLTVFSLVPVVLADPLSKRIEVDFFRDVPSRNLKGLATRSDGRLVSGPTFTDLTGAAPADLLWALEAGANPAQWFIGSGPDGKIFDVSVDYAKSSYTARELAKLDDPHVFALRRLPDGNLLAGTSPKGGLYLLRANGEIAARIALPADSILDLLIVSDNKSPAVALVATGNPGRIYRVDVAKFATSGVVADKVTDAKLLAERGITQFGEIRDRNVRRLARLPDGRIIAGSAPRGNVYAFPADGGAPMVLQENRDAEVTDLLPQPNGDLYATFVFAGTSGESRITRPKPANPATPAEAIPEPSSTPERFSGRSSLMWFPAGGFPETLVGRGNLAFYRVLRHDNTLILAGGDQGDVLGYDLRARNSLTFAGSNASQLNALVPVAGAAGQFVALKNNAPGLAVLDFNAGGAREAETRRIDLLLPSQLGALRFHRLRGVDSSQLALSLQTNFGTDEVEGWSSWTSLDSHDGGWSAPELRGRYTRLRVKLPAGATPLEIDKASLYFLPQNRRPQLGEFRVLPANFGLIPATEAAPPATISLSQIMSSNAGGESGGDKRRSNFMSSQLTAQPGAQIVLWTVNDPDGDNIVCTFSLRRDGTDEWTDVAVASREPYAQFDISHLPEGIYFTRLVASEEGPRPAPQRLTTTFETDDLVIDRTAPQITEASAAREGGTLRVSVRGRDTLSLLEGVEFVFNHGVKEILEQPSDGILDGREETFVLEIPLAKVAEATSVEVLIYDTVGNSSARRIALPR